MNFQIGKKIVMPLSSDPSQRWFPSMLGWPSGQWEHAPSQPSLITPLPIITKGYEIQCSLVYWPSRAIITTNTHHCRVKQWYLQHLLLLFLHPHPTAAHWPLIVPWLCSLWPLLYRLVGLSLCVAGHANSWLVLYSKDRRQDLGFHMHC